MGLRSLLACALVVLLMPVRLLAEPALVLVDPTAGFATIYVSMPSDLPADARRELETFVTEHDGAYLEPWASFVRDVQKHIGARVRKNDYPEVDVAESIVLLLREFELEQIGLTWNGGVAVSPRGFVFAEETYGAWLQDRRFVARPWNRQSDPVHPWNHTGRLLNEHPSTGWRC